MANNSNLQAKVYANLEIIRKNKDLDINTPELKELSKKLVANFISLSNNELDKRYISDSPDGHSIENVYFWCLDFSRHCHESSPSKLEVAKLIDDYVNLIFELTKSKAPAKYKLILIPNN